MKLRNLVMFVAIPFLVVGCGGSDSDGEKPDDGGEPVKSWHLEWMDDFDKDDVDGSVWGRIPRGSSDWCANMSTDDCVFEKRSSSIVMKGIATPSTVDDERPFLSGGLQTRGLKKFMPPMRIEVYARMGSAQGAWPAIWLMPFAENKPWPDCGEIDVMEHLNHDYSVYQSIHSTYYDTQHNDNPAHSRRADVNPGEWNIYCIEVLQNEVNWYINGRNTFSYPRLSPAVEGQYPFFVGQYLIIDMQLGGQWVGAVNAAELPVELEVDWVKYSRYY